MAKTNATQPNGAKERKAWNLPHGFVILFFCIVIAAVLTWVVPPGEFDRITNEAGQKVVLPGSWHAVEGARAGLMKIFTAIPIGMTEAASVVFAVFLIGGGFGIVEKTGAISLIVEKTLKGLGKRGIILIPIIMVVFSLISSFIGLVELSMIYIPILIPICLALGYDSMTAVAIGLIACGGGFTAALTNPFTVALAQKLADLPLYSGMGLRIAFFAVITITGIIYVMRYAMRVKKNPATSMTTDIDVITRQELGLEVEQSTASTRLNVTGIVFVVGLVFLIFAILKWKWLFNEIGAYFVILGVACGAISGMKINEIAETFVKGLQDFVVAALAGGLARGVVVILNSGHILDTVVNGISSIVGAFPGFLSAWGMMFAQTLLSVPIPSGSGLTLISMPIMFPLGDLVGVSKQTAILALQIGDGFTNILAPTLGFLWAALGVAKVPYERWVKFYVPLFIIWLVISGIFLSYAQMINW